MSAPPLLGAMRQLYSGLARTHVYRWPCYSQVPIRNSRQSARSISGRHPCCTMCRRQVVSHRPFSRRRKEWTPCRINPMATDAATVEQEATKGMQQMNIVEVLRSRGLVQVGNPPHLGHPDPFQLRMLLSSGKSHIPQLKSNSHYAV